MSTLRRMPLPRLLGFCVAVVVLGASATALADTLASGPTPPPAPLAQALHQALSGPSVGGVSANIELTNHLLEIPNQEGLGSDGAPGASNPLLTGGSGRLWISDSGKLRLELQSESGDTELVDDGARVSIYDAATNSLYRFKLPAQQGDSSEASSGGAGSLPSGSAPEVPSVEAIEQALTKLSGRLDLSGAIPTDVAGQPAYAVRLAPAQNGGLLESVEVVFDATHGLPLKLAVYAKGAPNSAVIELKASAISFGPIAESTFELNPPASAKVTEVKLAKGQPGAGSASTPSAEGGSGTPGSAASASGSTAVAAALPFTLNDPSEVDGLARSQVKLVHRDGKPAALISYGTGLGTIAVLETPSQSSARFPRSSQKTQSGGMELGSESEAASGGPRSEAGASGAGAGSVLGSLPSVSIDGASATELPTALGTVLSFQQAGVSYVVAGSITPASARAAAGDLLS